MLENTYLKLNVNGKTKSQTKTLPVLGATGEQNEKEKT
jgi:hypothetical protein